MILNKINGEVIVKEVKKVNLLKYITFIAAKSFIKNLKICKSFSIIDTPGHIRNYHIITKLTLNTIHAGIADIQPVH